MYNYNGVVHFYPCVKFNFPLFWGMVIMYDYEFETKENKICTEDKTKPQQQYCSFYTHIIAPYICPKTDTVKPLLSGYLPDLPKT